MAGKLRSASLTRYVEVARRFGLDPHRMVSEFGLPPGCLRDPELMIPVEAVRQLLEASAQRSGCEGFGLLMAEARRLSNLGAVGLLIREQPTLRLALEVGARYGNRLNQALSLTIEEASDVVVLREELIIGRSGSVRQTTELAIGVAFRILRAFLGPGWQPRRVCFAHAAPADTSVHRRVFGRTVEFDRDFNGIVWPRSDLDVPNPNADPELARLARQLIESGPANKAANITTQVRDLVVMLLGTGTCTTSRVAQHLGVDPRTMHRRLVREGRTFSRIVDAVRRELAERYMRDRNRTLAEVSVLLGFSAASGFSRWYRQRFRAAPSSRRGRIARRGS
jgi:AraC-like DNA-binding protein